MMKLSPSQELILKAYAKECHPSVYKLDGDFDFLCNESFIHREQDHITDKGCAYVVAILGMSYSKFIRIHKWQKRHEPVSRPVREIFRSSEEQDIYFREKYKANLKYDTWGSVGNEQRADPLTLRKIGAEVCLGMLNDPHIDWKKVRGWMSSKIIDPVDRKLIEEMGSREYLKQHLKLELQKLET